MCGNATLATEVSSSSIKVASMTDTGISQGLKLGRDGSADSIAARVVAGILFASLLIGSPVAQAVSLRYVHAQANRLRHIQKNRSTQRRWDTGPKAARRGCASEVS